MNLLSPIAIGPIELKNRVAIGPHGVFHDFFNAESQGEKYIDYQERRAQGGVGLQILGALHVHASSPFGVQQPFDPVSMPAKYRRLSERVHAHGAKVFQQLFHVGAQGVSDAHRDMEPLWGFSPRMTTSGEAVHVMEDAEVEQVIDAFVAAARCACENGLDGIELHGTHGYIILQSLEPYANSRSDKWGQRLFFLRELATRVRAAIGPDKALGLRMTLDDFLTPETGGLGVERLQDLAVQIVDMGLFDYFNTSEGKGGGDYYKAIGTYRHKFGEFLPLAKALREKIGRRIPVMAATKIPTVDLAEQALQDGSCDLVSMVRAHIADPDIVVKLQDGLAGRIRPCTGSNQGCIDRNGVAGISCFHNPEVGEERRFIELAKIKSPLKKVLVVGGGPAGMKAAEIAAGRGHKVTLVEAGDRLGGRLNLVETLGDATSLLSSTIWVEEELRRLGVDIRTQTLADEAFVRAFAPDEIVMATGAQARDDIEVPTDDSVLVLNSDAAVSGVYQGQKFSMKGERVLMLDLRANHESALIVEGMVKQGAAVTVATPHPFFGANMGMTNLGDYRALLPAWGVRIMAQTVLRGVSAGEAELLDGVSGQIVREAFDFIVSGVAPRPRDEMLEAFRRHAPTRIAGDVVAPRSAMHAFREGDRAGRTL